MHYHGSGSFRYGEAIKMADPESRLHQRCQRRCFLVASTMVLQASGCTVRASTNCKYCDRYYSQHISISSYTSDRPQQNIRCSSQKGFAAYATATRDYPDESGRRGALTGHYAGAGALRPAFTLLFRNLTWVPILQIPYDLLYTHSIV